MKTAPDTYVVWRRNSSYREDGYVSATTYRPGDYTNAFGRVTYEILLITKDWPEARARIEAERKEGN
jgi:hypothetical protein